MNKQSKMINSPTYIFDAADKPSLPLHPVPLIEATEESVKGYGCLVDDPDGFEIEITRWPAQGWRPVDEDSGDEGGTVEGIFTCEWEGDVLFGRNEAVHGYYVLGWSRDPQEASALTHSGSTTWTGWPGRSRSLPRTTYASDAARPSARTRTSSANDR